MTRAYDSLDELLAESPVRHLCVSEYAISMGRNMWFRVNDGDFATGADFLAKGCTYWRGPFEGGPWHLVLERIPDHDGGEPTTRLRLLDRDGAFELECESIVPAGRRGS